MKLTVGADPEVFVRDLKTHRHYSAHEFPCGDKWKPRRTKNGSVQIDGTALEFNVRPSKTKKDFIRNVNKVMGDLETIAYRHDPNCVLSFVPYVNFGHEYLNTLPQQYRVLGCNMDYNAYTKAPNPPPDADLPIRTAAGHVHLGWGKFPETPEHFQLCCELAKELDFYLGLPSLKWDPDPHRRELYGKAGSFRPKAYGMEYRVLSNRWVEWPELCGYVFTATKTAARNFFKKKLLYPEYGEFARVCINENRIEWEEKAPRLAEFLKIDTVGVF